MAQANWVLSSRRPGLDHDPVHVREFGGPSFTGTGFFSECFGCQYLSTSLSYPVFFHLPLTLFNLSIFSF